MSGLTSFDADILPLFTQLDIRRNEQGDLASYDDVKKKCTSGSRYCAPKPPSASSAMRTKTSNPASISC
jgi:hypothetical protein